MKTNDTRLTPAQEQFKKDMGLSKMNNQSFPSVVEDTTRNREEMDKALRLSGGIRWDDVKPQPMRKATKQDWDDLCKDVLFREAVPLLGDEQKEVISLPVTLSTQRVESNKPCHTIYAGMEVFACTTVCAGLNNCELKK